MGWSVRAVDASYGMCSTLVGLSVYWLVKVDADELVKCYTCLTMGLTLLGVVVNAIGLHVYDWYVQDDAIDDNMGNTVAWKANLQE